MDPGNVMTSQHVCAEDKALCGKREAVTVSSDDWSIVLAGQAQTNKGEASG